MGQHFISGPEADRWNAVCSAGHYTVCREGPFTYCRIFTEQVPECCDTILNSLMFFGYSPCRIIFIHSVFQTCISFLRESEEINLCIDSSEHLFNFFYSRLFGLTGSQPPVEMDAGIIRHGTQGRAF